MLIYCKIHNVYSFLYKVVRNILLYLTAQIKSIKKLYSYELALYINNNDIEYAKLHEKIIVIFLQE